MSNLTPELVTEALKEVYDPEIPVNIVDLGLIYNVGVDDGEKPKRARYKTMMQARKQGGMVGVDDGEKPSSSFLPVPPNASPTLVSNIVGEVYPKKWGGTPKNASPTLVSSILGGRGQQQKKQMGWGHPQKHKSIFSVQYG